MISGITWQDSLVLSRLAVLSEALPVPLLPGLPHLTAPRSVSLGRNPATANPGPHFGGVSNLSITGSHSDMPVTRLNSLVSCLLALPGRWQVLVRGVCDVQ